MLFNLTDITTHISPANYDQGWQLFAEGQIPAPNIQRGGELITAIIPHPGNRHPFRVYVRTDKAADAVTIRGECSCTKKKDCEHVAAVLLQALEDKQAFPVDALLTAPHEKHKSSSPQQVLLYVLQPHEDGLLVETYAARCLKNGGYTAGGYFEPSRATHHTPPRFLEPADLELLNSLNQLPRSAIARFPVLDGPQSAPLLAAILASGRCFLRNADWGPRLEQGAARALSLQWVVDDFGNQCCDWVLSPAADQLILPSSPWYLDSEHSQCGAVESELPAALITELLNLPPVAPEQSNAVQTDLQQRYPGVSMPPLQHFEVVTALPVKPTPCLHLTTVDRQGWEDDEWIDGDDFVYLSFDYGGIALTRAGPATHFDGKCVTEVPRDKKAEQTAVKQLYTLGFEEDEDWRFQTGDDCFFPDVDLMASDLIDNDAEYWLDFQVNEIPKLRAQGWRIEYDNFLYQLVEASSWYCDVDHLEQQDWFSIGLGVEIDGRRIDLLPTLVAFLRNFPRGLPDAEETFGKNFIVSLVDEQMDEQDDQQDGERLLRLPAQRILPLLETLLEMINSKALDDDGQNLRLSRVQLARLTALDHDEDGPRLQWLGDGDIQQLAQRLRALDGIPEVHPPKGLMATLRPYQQQGLNWLQFLREYRLAGILADDMGLGKTVQALAHMLLEKEQGRADCPSLVIAPTSLMFNWRREVERFTPQLKILVLHGPQRHEHFAGIANYDLILTTYPLLSRDKKHLLAHTYHLLILDEAQVIKNPKAQASRVVREVNARHRLCLTGTPLENHLGELWSLFDFLLPDLLGNSKQFRQFFRSPIEKYGSETTAERLSRRIRPFLLRRSKQQVAAELPPKTEIIQTVVLEGKQRELYETVRLAMHRRVREEIERQGMGRSHIVVLDALLKLRQVCCDPRLVKIGSLSQDKAQKVTQSAKLAMLMELLPEMVEEGRRILIFSQFTTMLGLIEDELKNANLDYVKLTGQTRDREKPVQQFQDGKVPLFLISLKAGGVGLNLTRADTVIHYDPWWNPAVERQATDRAHRIGQQQAVFVYKLICEGTLEEKIHAMQQRKQALADSLFRHGDNNEPQWNEQDLQALFEPLDS